MDQGHPRVRLDQARRELIHAERLHADALDQMKAALVDAASEVPLAEAARWAGISPATARELVAPDRRASNRSWRLDSDSAETCWHLL